MAGFYDCRRSWPAPFPQVQSMTYWRSWSIRALWRVKLESQINTGFHEKIIHCFVTFCLSQNAAFSSLFFVRVKIESQINTGRGFHKENHSLLCYFLSVTECCLLFSVPAAGPGYEITFNPVVQSNSRASILWTVPQSVRNQSLAYIVITVESQRSDVNYSQTLTSYNTSGSFALSGLSRWCRNRVAI